MRALIVMVCGAMVLLAPIAWGEESTRTPATMATPKLDPAVVPRGKTYVLLDPGGKKIADFVAGQKTSMAVTDCVQVNCPDTFDKNVVCWKCKERLKSN